MNEDPRATIPGKYFVPVEQNETCWISAFNTFVDNLQFQSLGEYIKFIHVIYGIPLTNLRELYINEQKLHTFSRYPLTAQVNNDKKQINFYSLKLLDVFDKFDIIEMIKSFYHQEKVFAYWRKHTHKLFIQEKAIRKGKIQNHCYCLRDRMGRQIGNMDTWVQIWQIADQDAPKWEELGFFENKADWIKEIDTWEFWVLEKTHEIKNLKARLNCTFTGNWYYNTHLKQRNLVTFTGEKKYETKVTGPDDIESLLAAGATDRAKKYHENLDEGFLIDKMRNCHKARWNK